MSSTAIQSVDCELYKVPLAEVLSDAKHGDHTHFELIIVRITTTEGLTGTGYSYTGGVGGQAIMAMLEYDLVPALLEQDASQLEQLHEQLYWRIHYVGRGGIAAFAISAVDIALWDLRLRRQNQSLYGYLGGKSPLVDVYAGGIDLNFSLEKLQTQTERYLDQGFANIKIKVGRPDLSEDVERVAAIRKMIGRGRLMVDANYALSVEQAISASEAFHRHDIYWFEEPIIPDNYHGYATVAEATDIPLAMGENLHTLEEFDLAFKHAKLGFIQPDASNCGGISGWLSVARLAAENGIPICSHGMQELHVSLLAAQPHAGYLEAHSFPIHEYTHRPLQIENTQAVAPDSVGTGVEFNYDLLRDYRIL